MITILIVDDHAVVRDGLRSLFEAYDDLEVIGDVGDGLEAVTFVQQIQPTIVLMDIELPGQSGIEATRAIRACCPETHVVMLSMHATDEYIYQALNAGACGYILKETAGKQVVTAVRAIAGGERYFSPRIIDVIIAQFCKYYHAPISASCIDILSAREREILHLVVSGKSSKEIGDHLFLSPKTIDTYRSRIMDKLNVHDLPSLIRLGIELDSVTHD